MVEKKSERLVRKIEELHDDAGTLRWEAESLLEDLQEKLNELRDIRDNVEDAMSDLSDALEDEFEAENDDHEEVFYAEDCEEYIDADDKHGEILNWIDKIELT